MEKVREYISNHPEIMGGCFRWYDLRSYHGIVNGQCVYIGVRVFSDDISIDTDSRADLIAWTYQYTGFDHFFEDPEKVKRDYTSEDGHKLIVTYYRDQDAHNDSPDEVIRLCPNADDEESEFDSFEAFKDAVIFDLDMDGYTVFEFVPGADLESEGQV